MSKVIGIDLGTTFSCVGYWDNEINSVRIIPNELGKKTGGGLAQAFAAILATVTHLQLNSNYLGNRTGAELAQAFAAILAAVTHLDLNRNKLGEKFRSFLIDCLSQSDELCIPNINAFLVKPIKQSILFDTILNS